MNDDDRVGWTDTRVVAVLLVPLMATIALIAGTASAELPATGTAEWARTLLGELETYDRPPDEKYDRDTYDVGWLDLDDDCQSGRHEVLIAESLETPTLDDRGCRVLEGLWIDPYTGTELRSAQDASIDHVVSLADAHRSGGWRWSERWRVAFANDIVDPATLAVSATQVNSSKGSEAPDQWMPERDESRCAYAVAWVRVKTRWQLDVTGEERAALDEALGTCVELGLPFNIESTPLQLIDFAADQDTSDDHGDVADSDDCDERYEPVCIPLSAEDLDCRDVKPRRFPVTEDPHGFDGDDDGIGCDQ